MGRHLQRLRPPEARGGPGRPGAGPRAARPDLAADPRGRPPRRVPGGCLALSPAAAHRPALGYRPAAMGRARRRGAEGPLCLLHPRQHRRRGPAHGVHQLRQPRHRPGVAAGGGGGRSQGRRRRARAPDAPVRRRGGGALGAWPGCRMRPRRAAPAGLQRHLLPGAVPRADPAGDPWRAGGAAAARKPSGLAGTRPSSSPAWRR